MDGINFNVKHPNIIIALALVALSIVPFVWGFIGGRYYQRQSAEQEKIECVKDSLYNEYITDKLNKQ